MIDTLLEYISVFIASGFNMNYGVGLSVTYGLSRMELFFLLSSGSVTGVALTLLLGVQIRDWWLRRFGNPDDQKKPSLTLLIWRRYGLLGLAFFSFLIGPLPAVAIALLSGMDKRRILIYLGCGKFIWSLVIAFLGYGHLQRIFAMVF